MVEMQKVDTRYVFHFEEQKANKRGLHDAGDILSPKIDKWSILGVTTAISGKRQEMDSAIVRPTPAQ